MSELDSHEVNRIYEACQDFTYAYKSYQLHPGSPQARVAALAVLGRLEATVNDHVSRETAKLEATLDGEEPPF